MATIINFIIEKITSLIIIFLAFLGLLADSVSSSMKNEPGSTFDEHRQIVENIIRTDVDFLQEFKIEDVYNPIVDFVDSTTKKSLDLINAITGKDPNIMDYIVESPSVPVPTITVPQQISPDSQTTSSPQIPADSSPESIDRNIEYNLSGEMSSVADVAINIICHETQGALTTASTGSGVIISPNGVILTNAHVAQLILLENSGFDIDCSIYQSTNKNQGYKAEIMYLSPEWVYQNAKLVIDPNPRGTGEHDYAFLLITETTNKKALPEKFPYTKINFDNNIYKINLPIKITGFPGGPLNIYDLRSAGTLRIDDSNITEIYSFTQKIIELFSTKRSPVAARGASGGGIFSDDSLIGITVTISPDGIGSRINAITTTYINNALQLSSGKNIMQMLTEDPKNYAASFKNRHLTNLSNVLKSQF